MKITTLFFSLFTFLFCHSIDANSLNKESNSECSDATFGNGFITTWRISTANDGITIPTTGTGYNYTVDWGDGTTESGFTGNASHIYAAGGTYQVEINGDFPRIYFNNTFVNSDRIISIEQWGDIAWTSMENAFSGCNNLAGYNATDTPNLSNATSLKNMFAFCYQFNGAIGNWNVSTITNMRGLFALAEAFNQDIGQWDVSNVTNMFATFYGAESFNHPLGNWDVSNVTNMELMLSLARKFNQPIVNWDVSNVTNMREMFNFAEKFNQDVSDWDVSNVTNMRHIFRYAANFNQSLGNWDIGNVTNLQDALINSGLSVDNYDQTLIGWELLPSLQPNVTLGAVNLEYCISETERQNLIDTYNWTINDGGINCPINNFITTWQTTTTNENITIPTTGSGYNYTVDWGDGNVEFGFTGNATHMYTTAGTYQIEISGDFPRIYFNDTGDKDKILSVEQWGTIAWTDMSDAFEGCSNLQVKATDTPNLSGVINLSRLFKGCTSLNANLNDWDVSSIRFMPGMFRDATNFNGQIGGWTTTSLELVANMFNNATNFNQPLGSWNVSNVNNMQSVFKGAFSFNQPLETWDVSNVTNMQSMFDNAISFNQPLEIWNTSNVTNMKKMFLSATNFNHTLYSWNVGNVTDMHSLFKNAISFNQPLETWNVGNITNMENMFNGAEAYNYPVDFWDTSNVTNMRQMFKDALNFNHSLGQLDISNVQSMENMFKNVTLSTANYDATLIGWNALPSLQPNVNFNAGNSTYCFGELERQNIINTHGWTIDDGGLDSSCVQSATSRSSKAEIISKEKVSTINHFTIYPNPAKDYFEIKGLSDINLIEIYDVTGKKVTSISNPTNTIDTSTFKAGVFFVKLFTEMESKTVKLVKE